MQNLAKLSRKAGGLLDTAATVIPLPGKLTLNEFVEAKNCGVDIQTPAAAKELLGLQLRWGLEAVDLADHLAGPRDTERRAMHYRQLIRLRLQEAAAYLERI